MTAGVKIPVRVVYNGKGFDELDKDAKRAYQQQIRATREQLAEHRKVQQLTAKLDKDLAAGASHGPWPCLEVLHSDTPTPPNSRRRWSLLKTYALLTEMNYHERTINPN